MNILLPIDENSKRAESAVNTLKSIPCTDELYVFVLNVESDIEIFDGEGGTVSSESWFDPDKYPKSVRLAGDILEDADISYEIQREHGEPSEAILNFTEGREIDWIFMAGRKRTPVGKVLFGSVTQSVLLNSDIPVTVVLD